MTEAQPKPVSTEDAIASFLWDLVRDHLPFGTIEKIITEMETLGPTVTNFSDPALGTYILSLARRLHTLNIKRK